MLLNKDEYIIIFTLGIKDPFEFGTNESWSRMLLNRRIKTEMRWNKKKYIITILLLLLLLLL